MRVDILNELGRDAPVSYLEGVGRPDPRVHPPVNYWAFAAATGGRFCQRLDQIDGDADAVIVLLRRNNRHALRAVRALKARGMRVYLSWKETGTHQITEQTGWFWERRALRNIHALADGAVATTRESVARYREFGGPHYRVHFIPTCYPVDVPEWDFSRPLAQRNGIFIGTRQFDIATRRHAEALQLAARAARQTGCRVTIINTDGAAASRRIRALLAGVAQLNLIEQRLDYPEYLRLMAAHRVVLQRDVSNVPGQVAGDALLCRVVNVGGNGTIQEIAFAGYSRLSEDEPALLAALIRLLSDDADYEAAVRSSQAQAQAQLSFAAGRRQLQALAAGA